MVAVTEEGHTEPKASKGALKKILGLGGLVLWTYVALQLASAMVAFPLGFLIGSGWSIDLESTLTKLVVNAVVYALAVILTVFVPWRLFRGRYRTTRDEMGLRGLPMWRDIGLGVAGYFGSAVVGMLVLMVMMAVFPDVNWEQEQDVGFSNLFLAKDLAMAFVALVVIAPICEELIFRGWLYGKLRARTSVFVATLLVSLLFALVHGQLNVGVVVFVMSVVNCLLRELTGTIYSGILVHIIRNALAFGFMFIWV